MGVENGINIPKTKRGMATMDKISRAAEKLFYENGYYNTSINDITNRAGVGAGTFYIYFESKKSLYEYLLTDYGETIRKHIREAVKGCKTRREMEREGIKAWLLYIREHKYVFNIIWESLYIDKRLFDAYYESFSKHYERNIIQAQKDGKVAKVDPEVMSYALMGISNFIGIHWAVYKNDADLDYIAEEAVKILDGIFVNA